MPHIPHWQTYACAGKLVSIVPAQTAPRRSWEVKHIAHKYSLGHNFQLELARAAHRPWRNVCEPAAFDQTALASSILPADFETKPEETSTRVSVLGKFGVQKKQLLQMETPHPLTLLLHLLHGTFKWFSNTSFPWALYTPKQSLDSHSSSVHECSKCSDEPNNQNTSCIQFALDRLQSIKEDDANTLLKRKHQEILGLGLDLTNLRWQI